MKHNYILYILIVIVILYFLAKNSEGFKDSSGNMIDQEIPIVGLIFLILIIVLLLAGNLSRK